MLAGAEFAAKTVAEEATMGAGASGRSPLRCELTGVDAKPANETPQTAINKAFLLAFINKLGCGFEAARLAGAQQKTLEMNKSSLWRRFEPSRCLWLK
jgi:hypothetical protein